jgi:hypothetical protein
MATCSAAQASFRTNSTRGRLVWNKVRMVKDPDTGKRLSRPNPKNEWQTADVICALSLRNYSTQHKVANRRTAIRTRISSDDHGTCCQVSSGVEPAAQGCLRTGRIIQDAFASVLKLPVA